MRTASVAAVTLVAAFGATIHAQEPNFGRALASDNSTLAIGQPANWYGPGTVYIYSTGPSGQLVERQRITASDPDRMDSFGQSIAIAGNRLAVGAPMKDQGKGAVYLFERPDGLGDWRQVARIPSSSPDGGQFGSSLVLVDEELFVGAPGSRTVSHFRRNGGQWISVGGVAGGSGDAGFAAAMALHDDYLLVGAPAADGGRGAISLLKRDPSGGLSSAGHLTVPDLAAPGGARAGTTIAVSGNQVLAGAPGAASVIVYSMRQGATWILDTVLTAPPDLQRRASAGAAVALVDGELWVGAPGTNGGNGTVIRYPSTPGGWGAPVRLNADSASGNHWPFAFGYSITSFEGHGIISMPSRDFGEGRVMVAARTGADWSETQLLTGEIHAIGGGTTSPADCSNGVIGPFPCEGIQLVGHLPNSALGGERGTWLNAIWGWTDLQSGREITLAARRDGISFVDITDPARPRTIGDLPRTVGSPPSTWRDVKVLNDHAYVVADGAGAHGMQIFDLARLRPFYGSDSITVFAPDTTYREVHSSHNVVADTESGYLYIVGANSGGESCGGGLHIVDARNPKSVSFSGCYNDREGSNPRGYTHDAQCLVYRGPDVRYQGRQICVGSNEQEINIADVTDKASPKLIGRSSYPHVAYAHQGWFDAEQRYFYMNDELDELNGLVEGTRTIIWDLQELDDPIVAGIYTAKVNSSDHNLFIVGNRAYLANYGSGLRVLDISDRTSPREIGFIDTAPLDEDAPGFSAAQSGAWSNYPFFPSGVVVFTSVREGLFMVKVREPVP